MEFVKNNKKVISLVVLCAMLLQGFIFLASPKTANAQSIRIEQSKNSTYLSDLTPTSQTTGWNGVVKDRAPDHSSIKLLSDGQEIEFAKGLGTHAPSKLVYQIPEGKTFFKAYIGFDDAFRNSRIPSAEFKVLLDNKEVYNSEVFTSKTDAQEVNITLNGAKEITLITESLGEAAQDHTVWADAKFLNQPIYLSDLKAKHQDVYGGIMLDKAPNGSSIKLNTENGEVEYAKGVGAHAPSTLVYEIPQNAQYFETYAGLDDASRNNRLSSVLFKVFVDNRQVYSSMVHSGFSYQDFIKVDVSNSAGKELKLVVEHIDKNYNDHACWGDAKFTSSKLMGPKLEMTVKDREFTTDASKNLTVREIVKKAGIKATVGNSIDTDAILNSITSRTDYVPGMVGTYSLQLRLTNNFNQTITQNVKITTTPSEKYLSDIKEESARVGWRHLEKDKAPDGSSIKLNDYFAWTHMDNKGKVTYKKGLGAHADSEIVYDLTKEPITYNAFQSFIGIDDAVDYRDDARVEFKVYGDDKLLYQSGLMTSKDHQKYININISDVKKLKLVTTDGGNGKGADHSCWADARLVNFSETPSKDGLYLSSLHVNQVASEVNGASYQNDKSAYGTPIVLNQTVNGTKQPVRYNKGIGQVAESSIQWNIPEGYTRLKAKLGVNSDWISNRQFRIVINSGAKGIVYEKTNIKATDEPIDIDIDITGARTISIFLDDLGQGESSVVLANAAVYK